MLVLWKANFSGSREQLEKVDGPYYAQDADLLYLTWTKSGNIGISGREFLPWVMKNKIPLEPVSWQVALTEKEFWG